MSTCSVSPPRTMAGDERRRRCSSLPAARRRLPGARARSSRSRRVRREHLLRLPHAAPQAGRARSAIDAHRPAAWRRPGRPGDRASYRPARPAPVGPRRWSAGCRAAGAAADGAGGVARLGVIRDQEGTPSDEISMSDLAFHALREYVPGDELRHVHWRSSAKANKLQIRQYHDTRRSHLTVVLDDDRQLLRRPGGLRDRRLGRRLDRCPRRTGGRRRSRCCAATTPSPAVAWTVSSTPAAASSPATSDPVQAARQAAPAGPGDQLAGRRDRRRGRRGPGRRAALAGCPSDVTPAAASAADGAATTTVPARAGTRLLTLRRPRRAARGPARRGARASRR